MMPLCTTASVFVQSTCGCAFISHGRPWVAHRVCAMPSEPAGEPTFANCASRFEILPRALQISRPWPLIVATPAESYPRYSSRFRAGTSTSTALLVPMYPTMPHIQFYFPVFAIRLMSGDCRLTAFPFASVPLNVCWAVCLPLVELHHRGFSLTSPLAGTLILMPVRLLTTNPSNASICALNVTGAPPDSLSVNS